MDSAYVLDSYALLAHFEDEPGGEKVRRLLGSAQAGKTALYLSVINLGEVYYVTLKERGVEEAEQVLFTVAQLPIRLVNADRDLTLVAARLKGLHPVAYADCFAAALAAEKKAKVVTGDPEFRKFGEAVRVEWM